MRRKKKEEMRKIKMSISSDSAEQVNNKADLHDTNTKMAENMIESANILDFDKMIKKA